MKQIIWEKLIINVGINALTALTGIRNGLIAEIPEAGALSRLAVLEAVQVARSRGLNIKDDMADRTIAVARATAANRSSMGQDVDRRKRTEIDFINGAVVRFAEEALIPVPINRTLTCLIKIMECSFTSRA